MLPFPVVKHLNVFKAHVSGLVSCLEPFTKDALVFETVEPAFRWCIVPAVTLSTHRTSHAIFRQQRLKGMARVLTSPIRVMDQARSWPAPKPGHGQCVGHNISSHAWFQRPANHFPVKQIQNDGQVQPAFICPQVGDVGRPDFIRRAVLIHGQFLRKDQVATIDELDIFPSLFPMHTFYWGDWHRDRTVGPVNADNISPTGWVRERGMKFSSHHDAPVAFPDSMRVLSATVTRRSRSGDILGPDQRVDVLTALKAMTIWPAWQHFEENSKGSIAPGKVADFVILTENPLTINPETLADIKVAQTVKRGKVIYSLDALPTKASADRPVAMGDVMSRMLDGWQRHAKSVGHVHGHGPELLMEAIRAGLARSQMQ